MQTIVLKTKNNNATKKGRQKRTKTERQMKFSKKKYVPTKIQNGINRINEKKNFYF